MYGEMSLFLRLLSLSTGKRLALALVMFAVSLGFYELVFPATYFGPILLLPLVCAAWLFGWRGGLLCIAGLTLALGVRYGLASGAAFWHSTRLAQLMMGTLYGLIVCLAVGALRYAIRALLDERQAVERVQQAYQQEHALNEWKDHTLQDLNHELRIPLTQTDGYLELLETYGDTLDSATHARFIAFARSGCEELLHLTRTAMETMQASGKQHPLKLNVFSLRHEVHTALAHCEPRLLQDHHVELEIAASTRVCADARFVRQVVRNLLTNACKYTPAQTQVIVSAAPLEASAHSGAQAGMICVCVRDYGPGIPPAQQAALFQRFVRLPNATASAQPGSGLGLAICKQLIEAMGGTIWIESTGRDGEGCCFSFTLPGAVQSCALEQAKCDGENNDRVKARRQDQQEGLAASAP